MTAAAFDPDVVAAVCRHMNEDHADDGLLICRSLAGSAEAVAARAVDVDATGMRFAVTEPDGSSRDVVVPFDEPVSERPQIRLAVVALYEKACAAAGVPPRSHG